MHSEDHMNKILEASREAAQHIMDIGKQAGVCPHCFLIQTMAMVGHCLTDEHQSKPMSLDYVIYAMLQEYYEIVDARDEASIKDVSKFH